MNEVRSGEHNKNLWSIHLYLQSLSSSAREIFAVPPTSYASSLTLLFYQP